MNKTYVIWQAGSNTIRQMPENYLICDFTNGYWKVLPDMAADKDLCIHAFAICNATWDNRYKMTGEELAGLLNNYLATR